MTYGELKESIRGYWKGNEELKNKAINIAISELRERFNAVKSLSDYLDDQYNSEEDIITSHDLMEFETILQDVYNGMAFYVGVSLMTKDVFEADVMSDELNKLFEEFSNEES